MQYETIIVEKGKVASICINRPNKRNALNQQAFDEILHAVAELDQEVETKVIVFKGMGKGFCSGADLGGMSDTQISILEKRDFTGRLPRVMEAMAKSRKLIIAQVHGFAVAGGFGLAMAADMAICTKSAKLGMPEIKRGIMPMNIMAPVSRSVPKNKLMEMMFTGEYICGEEAARWGMVNMAVEDDELEDKVNQLAASISRHSADCIRLGKEAYYTLRDVEYFKSFSYLNNMLMMTMMTEETNDKMDEFLNGKEGRANSETL